MLKENLVFVQGYIWNVDCIAYNNTLLCASWTIVVYLGSKFINNCWMILNIIREEGMRSS